MEKEIQQKLEEILMSSQAIASKEENISAIHILQIRIEKLMDEVEHIGFMRCAKRMQGVINEVKSKED